MFWCAGITLLYFIASIVVATVAKHQGIYGAAAVSYHLKKYKLNFKEFFFDSFLVLQLL